MKRIAVLSIALASLSSAAFAQNGRFAAPSVRTGETCQPVTEAQKAKGFVGFERCSPSDWALESLTNGMEFSHKVVDGFLVGELKAPSTGWVGFGLGSMADADMIIGFVDDSTGVVEAQDYFTAGRRFPSLDTEGGGTDDVLFVGGAQANGVTTVRFVRALRGNGITDKVVTPGLQQRVIFAFGGGDELRRHPGGATAAYEFTFVP